MKIIPDGQAIIKEQYDGMEIIIPSKKHWLLLVIPVLLIFFWWFTYGEFSLSAIGAQQGISFDWFWIFWAVAIVGVILRNTWRLMAGKEIIDINSTKLSVKKQGRLFAKPKEYALANARYFRVEENADKNADNVLWEKSQSGFEGTGTICFEYGTKTVRFGDNLSEQEAAHLLKMLKDKRLLSEKNFLKELG